MVSPVYRPTLRLSSADCDFREGEGRLCRERGDRAGRNVRLLNTREQLLNVNQTIWSIFRVNITVEQNILVTEIRGDFAIYIVTLQLRMSLSSADTTDNFRGVELNTEVRSNVEPGNILLLNNLICLSI